jgi:AraC-like DNA-binding protein
VELVLDRIDDLKELASQRVLNLDFRQHGDGAFHARMRAVVTSPAVRAVRWSHSAGITFRDQALVKDGDESVSLVYPLNSSIAISHLGRERRLTPGHSILIRHDAVGHIGAYRDCRYVALVLAPTILPKKMLAGGGLLAELLPNKTPALRLLIQYVSALSARTEPMPETLAAAAGRHIADLVRLAGSELSERPVQGLDGAVAGARLEVALACLRNEFRNADLSVALVASAQGVSPRYLHRLFEQAGIRFSERLNEMRLQATIEALGQAGGKPISMIAFDCGFSDIAHFNRLFKKRFGVTPSAVRDAGRR